MDNDLVGNMVDLTRPQLLQGLPFTPFASDILGRRAALFLGSVIMLAGVAVQITAKTVKIFIAARIVSTSTMAVVGNRREADSSNLKSVSVSHSARMRPRCF